MNSNFAIFHLCAVLRAPHMSDLKLNNFLLLSWFAALKLMNFIWISELFLSLCQKMLKPTWMSILFCLSVKHAHGLLRHFLCNDYGKEDDGNDSFMEEKGRWKGRLQWAYSWEWDKIAGWGWEGLMKEEGCTTQRRESFSNLLQKITR